MKPLQNRICSALLALCLLAGGCGMLAACQPVEKYSLETENLIDAVLNDAYDWSVYSFKDYHMSVAIMSPTLNPPILSSEPLQELHQRPDALPALLNRCSQLLDAAAKYDRYTDPNEILLGQCSTLFVILRLDPVFSAQMTEADLARLEELEYTYDIRFTSRYEQS